MRAKRRFYKQAAAGPASGGGFAVLLDGRPIKTPEGAALVVAQQGLAEAIAAEWAAQETEIRPHRMPLMRLTCTAIDRISVVRQEVIDHLLAYAGTDLLCYRAKFPADLVARQAAAWDPLLDWLAARHGARLTITDGVLAIPQPDTALACLRAALETLDSFHLSALSAAARSAGSLAIALALAEGHLDAGQAFDVSQIDETYQMEKWGEDDEALAHRAELRADFEAAARLFALLSPSEV
ncbi:ATPase [Magnetospira thiophila]